MHFQEHRDAFLAGHQELVTWYMVFNVWKIMNYREPDGLGLSVFACLAHPNEVRHVPHSYKSRFCSVCTTVMVVMTKFFGNILSHSVKPPSLT